MNDLTILHLSDLHIDGQAAYPEILKNLLVHIKEEIAPTREKTLVVAVTGDIIDKGNKAAIDNAKKFFEDLKKTLGNKVAGIVLVPGNHDIFRSNSCKFIIPACRTFAVQKEYEFGNTFYDTFWKNIQEAYESSGYMELSKYIYNLFEMDIEEKIVERTFGVVPITIEKKTYFFVLLNTSWCCIDENDTRKIVLGKFQLDKISEEAIKLRRNIEPSLSICLGHHPLQCLEGNEETTALMELTDSSRIMANAYLCGHTHNRTVVNWNNNVRTLNTFMTGIGQGDAENDRVRAQHTRKRLYAFYVFNIELNSVDIYSYGTNAEGNFKPDFDLYTKNIEENQKKIVFPINMQKTMPYIWLTGGPNSTGKACYLSDELLDRFQEYEIRMSNFRKEMCDLLWRTRVLYFDDGIDESKIKTIIEIWEKEQEKTKEEQEITVDGILYAHLMLEKSVQGQQLMEELVGLDKGKNSRVFDDFYAYLTQICAILRNNLVDEEKKTLVRFHFRFRLKDKMYSQLCISIPPECKPETMNMQPMQYDDLLKASYDKEYVLKT
jgi:ser/thr protein phosphatase family protein